MAVIVNLNKANVPSFTVSLSCMFQNLNESDNALTEHLLEISQENTTTTSLTWQQYYNLIIDVDTRHYDFLKSVCKRLVSFIINVLRPS